VNSAGNEVHFLGLSWSGGYNEPRSEHLERRPVLAASGAAMAISGALFDQLGGFEEQFFAYYEDADLSVRSWQSGHSVVYEPDARVLHRYEFSRNVGKYYLLERNRWSMLLTLLEGRTLALLAPMLVVQEIALWGLAIRQGWVGPKARSSIWLLRNWRWLRARRAKVAAVRQVSDRALAPLYSTRLDAANVETPNWVARVFGLMAAYWALVQRLLGGRTGDACLEKRLLDD
jgi:GT2 family glycosyltransferase